MLIDNDYKIFLFDFVVFLTIRKYVKIISMFAATLYIKPSCYL